eukprot:CAMPEP_0197639420 /NCGR_PEP_ID=MMETSP1338-20131121/14048_1 /TAXON_ID=43686 ORGANISM="Pelagodinium beii, Strain RCC1491" /NCGR_SAMPLE_ID=MMETSP1338 /ASSEMBLY_ACC=CAM_ASM_000754 /LENGTH=235 /DNA_ID=CAMNT_0043212147 /DNA_START=20 /DNA_END=724 /DNA_ORIENTATION=+
MAAYNPALRPGQHRDLIKSAERARDREAEKAEDEKVGAELQRKYKVFAEAAKGFKKGDSVRLRGFVGCKILESELQAFSRIESGLDADASYASEWEDAMMDMPDKFFTVNHACYQTGQLVIPALPGARGSQVLRESEWSRRFVAVKEGDEWALPASAFEVLQVEACCKNGHSLIRAELAWNEGYVHTRYCASCMQVIHRDAERYHCDEEHQTQTRGHHFSICLGCFESGYKSLQK